MPSGKVYVKVPNAHWQSCLLRKVKCGQHIDDSPRPQIIEPVAKSCQLVHPGALLEPDKDSCIFANDPTINGVARAPHSAQAIQRHPCQPWRL